MTDKDKSTENNNKFMDKDDTLPEDIKMLVESHVNKE